MTLTLASKELSTKIGICAPTALAVAHQNKAAAKTLKKRFTKALNHKIRAQKAPTECSRALRHLLGASAS
jgi:hypothetical protein